MNRSVCFLATLLTVVVSTAFGQSQFRDFITAKDGEMFEGKQPYRFLSFNIPNLAYTEDDMRFEQLSGFRLPTPFEINDALESIRQMGGRVARTYVLSVAKTNDPAGLPRHILSPGRLNEEAMVVLDEVLATANRRGVRLIIPFVDQASWWGGIAELAAFRGRAKEEFFSNPQVKADYKELVKLVLTRVNTRTGVRYNEDKAVLAWELGNELKAPKEWVAEMGPVVKALAPNQLLAESYFTATDNPGVDVVQDHLYQGDPVKMIEQIEQSVKRAAGKRVYLVGEFGFITTEGMRAVMDTIIGNPAIAGGLIWSLRFHNQDGGYYWHHEPWGGDFYKAFHWPGGPEGAAYDETHFMQLVRAKAYEIRGIGAPLLDPPAPPDLFMVTDGGVVNWRGSAGAAEYELHRATSKGGPWQTVARRLTDDATQYHPVAVDETPEVDKTYCYRLVAINEAGSSKPSAVFGPVKIRCRTFVDELRNLSLTYRRGGKPEIRSNDARNYKEDCHRLRGVAGDWIAYHVPGRIVGVKLYTFGGQAAPELEFRVGSDGERGELIRAKAEDYFAGKEMYNFKWPRLYQLDGVPRNGSSISIRFRSEAQIGRVEIEYQ